MLENGLCYCEMLYSQSRVQDALPSASICAHGAPLASRAKSKQSLAPALSPISKRAVFWEYISGRDTAHRLFCKKPSISLNIAASDRLQNRLETVCARASRHFWNTIRASGSSFQFLCINENFINAGLTKMISWQAGVSGICQMRTLYKGTTIL